MSNIKDMGDTHLDRQWGSGPTVTIYPDYSHIPESPHAAQRRQCATEAKPDDAETPVVAAEE